MQATSIALDHLLRAIGDPVGVLRHIGPGHPEYNRAQILRAAVGVMAKAPDTFPAIAQSIQIDSERATLPETDAHLAAAEAWLSGDPVVAAATYSFILSKWPHDVLALRLAQSCYFFLGWHDRFCSVIDSIASAWTPGEQGYDFVLAMASFAHAENGDAAYAEALGREALAKDPACPFGVHAVAHSIAASGRHGSGAQWMRDQRAQWSTASRMRTHNAWHLAMFDAEAGNMASALGILDGCLIPAGMQSPINACDAVALLWRLTVEGIDVEGRWRTVSDALEQKLTPGFWPYVDLHAAIAHMSAGMPLRVRHLTQAIEQCAEGDSHAASRARCVTVPGLRALDAWADGRYGEAAAHLVALSPFLGDAGGSRVQLEVFNSIQREADRRQHVRRLPSPSWMTNIPDLNAGNAEGNFHGATQPHGIELPRHSKVVERILS